MNIVELQNRILDYEGQLSGLMAEPTDEKVAQAKVIEGRLAETRDQLMAEANRIAEENAEMARAKAEPKAVSFAERILGPRDAFTGIEPGWKASAIVTQLTLPTPSRIDTGLPVYPLAPMGVLPTIPTVAVDGNETYFQAGGLDDAAQTWTTGQKQQNEIAWMQAVANLETIAHWIPVPKLTARRYTTLQSTISSTLLMGLESAKDNHVVAGNNSSGIVGLINQPGIVTKTMTVAEAAEAGKNVRDLIVETRAAITFQSGLAPNFVAVSPMTIAEMKTAKGSDGHYIFEEMVVNGTIDGMTVVEDINLDPGQALVYFNGAAQFGVADADEVSIGLTGNQFTENAYTLLAEGTYNLKVPFPGAIGLVTITD